METQHQALPILHSGATTDQDRTRNKLIEAQTTGSEEIFIVLIDRLLFNLLPDAALFFHPHFLTKEKKLTWDLGFSPLTHEEFQGLPSWGSTAIYDNLRGNSPCCFCSSKLPC